MIQKSVDDAAELFQAAGLGQASWKAALDGLAAVTGSTGAQLIGLGSEATVPLNVMTGVPVETGEAFVAVGGGDPAINSRVRVGLQAAELEVLDETAFTTAADMRLNPEYAEWIRTWDMHHTCLTNLVKEPDRHAGLALLRSERQGNVDDEQRRVFATLARHARAAVRTQLALEAQGTQLLAGAMEAVRATAFFCDAAGRVRGMTASAEALLSAGDVLRLRNGVLTTACEADRRGLEAALAEAVAGGAPVFAAAARRLNTDDRVFIEAAPLPASSAPGFGPRALLIVHGRGVDEARVAVAAGSLYGLSASESAIAAQLAAGRSPAAIAHERRVSLGTVRSQVRRIYQKVGVASQLELAARLPRL
ncbi:helix-turn-helix transcriptional regulator [Roseibacterium beibuensis]|uniref:helix-turn-helix transcriptional regulator n=1 Tax=[Roseibacterium] beibuensis TaxID=1193142 RepID=UPI00217D932F|nr:helix-turn-helix transcriptional regulator [Roseibacterium beibuensis]MCS6622548.1 helix-turn-helix transcriptional regulator [Roseibacterium beibuensis]